MEPGPHELYLLALLYGLVAGYGAGTCVESWIHERVMHAPPPVSKHFRKYNFLWVSYFSHHVVHHRLTYRHDYNRMFDSPAQRRRVEALISSQVSEAQAEQIIREQYGCTVRASGILKAISPLFLIGPLSLSLAEPPYLFPAIMGFLLTAPVFILFNIYLHPLLHMRMDRLRQASIPRILKWLALSRYGIFVRKYHYLHHKNERVNFNLLLGGDILRNRFRRPSRPEEQEMRAAGLI